MELKGRMLSMILAVAWVILGGPNGGFCSFAHAQESEAIKPGHIVHLARHIRADLIQLHQEADIQADVPEPLEVFQASPREVYYQALLLQNKLQILNYIYTGSLGIRRMGVPSTPITAADSVRLLREGQTLLADAMTLRSVDRAAFEDVQNPGLSSNRALQEVLITSAYVDNLMGDRGINDADVHQVVVRAAHRLLQLGAYFDGYVPPKRPTPIDGMSQGAVFNGLRRAYVFVRLMRVRSGYPTMALGEVPKGDLKTSAAEALMMAQLIYGHLDQLFVHAPAPKILPPVFYPGPINAAETYSWVHQMEYTSWELSELVAENTSWLQEAPIAVNDTPAEANTASEATNQSEGQQ